MQCLTADLDTGVSLTPQVDSIQKTNLYMRHQLLEKIMSEYEQTRTMMRERYKLQDQRKMANMNAALARQSLTQAMDKLRCTKDVSKLAGANGIISINDLVKRPHTAG